MAGSAATAVNLHGASPAQPPRYAGCTAQPLSAPTAVRRRPPALPPPPSPPSPALLLSAPLLPDNVAIEALLRLSALPRSYNPPASANDEVQAWRRHRRQRQSAAAAVVEAGPPPPPPPLAEDAAIAGGIQELWRRRRDMVLGLFRQLEMSYAALAARVVAAMGRLRFRSPEALADLLQPLMLRRRDLTPAGLACVVAAAADLTPTADPYIPWNDLCGGLAAPGTLRQLTAAEAQLLAALAREVSERATAGDLSGGQIVQLMVAASKMGLRDPVVLKISQLMCATARLGFADAALIDAVAYTVAAVQRTDPTSYNVRSLAIVVWALACHGRPCPELFAGGGEAAASLTSAMRPPPPPPEPTDHGRGGGGGGGVSLAPGLRLRPYELVIEQAQRLTGAELVQAAEALEPYCTAGGPLYDTCGKQVYERLVEVSRDRVGSLSTATRPSSSPPPPPPPLPSLDGRLLLRAQQRLVPALESSQLTVPQLLQVLEVLQRADARNAPLLPGLELQLLRLAAGGSGGGDGGGGGFSLDQNFSDLEMNSSSSGSGGGSGGGGGGGGGEETSPAAVAAPPLSGDQAVAALMTLGSLKRHGVVTELFRLTHGQRPGRLERLSTGQLVDAVWGLAACGYDETQAYDEGRVKNLPAWSLARLAAAMHGHGLTNTPTATTATTGRQRSRGIASELSSADGGGDGGGSRQLSHLERHPGLAERIAKYGTRELTRLASGAKPQDLATLAEVFASAAPQYGGLFLAAAHRARRWLKEAQEIEEEVAEAGGCGGEEGDGGGQAGELREAATRVQAACEAAGYDVREVLGPVPEPAGRGAGSGGGSGRGRRGGGGGSSGKVYGGRVTAPVGESWRPVRGTAVDEGYGEWRGIKGGARGTAAAASAAVDSGGGAFDVGTRSNRGVRRRGGNPAAEDLSW
ncbi:hypothetical protein VOLCADRAFT_93437 [Volvox carteri f. nagariensis]|uniref:Uncharacterized protein n=1 Tax=Volvox carteri f. nagariensis TaxID=3068 RepID=D8U246_VOLCA|nr:uncharacterized protein VOLCADRAFT_93437 [Volvox carteri f. nagariensis]EFJ46299.1 hypothetical protein VOLCADRAFT_93437 [Volvox carteri f. nagariensis]|eukprot:XP_002952746.1 hypothetical protein VOLCADRAFT_93437 [Volvox carteri f. nagariensis]